MVPFHFWGGCTFSSIGGRCFTPWVNHLAITPSAAFSDGYYSFLTTGSIPSIGEKREIEGGGGSERGGRNFRTLDGAMGQNGGPGVLAERQALLCPAVQLLTVTERRASTKTLVVSAWHRSRPISAPPNLGPGGPDLYFGSLGAG